MPTLGCLNSSRMFMCRFVSGAAALPIPMVFRQLRTRAPGPEPLLLLDLIIVDLWQQVGHEPWSASCTRCKQSMVFRAGPRLDSLLFFGHCSLGLAKLHSCHL